MSARRVSLREEWFIEDAERDISGLCPLCRNAAEAEILIFGPTVRDGLHEIFSASRATRVQGAMAGRGYRDHGDWDAAAVVRSIGVLIGMAAKNYPSAMFSDQNTGEKA